jgi:glycosyltransferase involved in cell wall biosynthesis
MTKSVPASSRRGGLGDLVVLDLRHRVPSGISEYAVGLSRAVATCLSMRGYRPAFVIERHQVPVAPDRDAIVAPVTEHYAHFDDSLARIVRRLQPLHVHSFGPLIDPRWCDSFSVTWHDTTRLQVPSLVYSDDEVALRASAGELQRMRSLDAWCSMRYGRGQAADSRHARALAWYAWLARAKAAFVVTISEASRDAVGTSLGLREQPLVVPPRVKRLSRGEPTPAWLADLRPFLLFVGTPDENKRLDLVCASLFQRAEMSDVRIVVAGDITNPSLGFRVRRHPTASLLDSERIFRPGYVSNALLAVLYREACATVVPSTHEGFCLPAAECVSVGGYLIASDLPAIRETLGDYPYVRWFDLRRPATLTAALDHALSTCSRGAYRWQVSRPDRVGELATRIGHAAAAAGTDGRRSTIDGLGSLF